MLTDMMGFIANAFNRHCSGRHNADFELCSEPVCKRARQLEVYLILTGQWLRAAFPWMMDEAER